MLFNGLSFFFLCFDQSQGKPTTIILTNFTYGAVKKQVHFVGQQQNGPRYVVVDLQGVLDNEDEVRDLVLFVG